MNDFGKILLPLSKNKADRWTIDDAIRGTSIMGGTGSGKTSASGKTIAKKFLQEGWGGLVLCAKTDEAKLWEQYCEETGREKDRITFTKGATFDLQEGETTAEEIIFNPIDYEMKREGEGAGETQNLTNIFMNIYRMGNRIAGESDNKEERYWDTALKRCLNRVIELLKLAGEPLSYENMVKVLNSASNVNERNLTDYLVFLEHDEELEEEREKIANDNGKKKEFREEIKSFDPDDPKNYCFKCLVKGYYYVEEFYKGDVKGELINSFNLVEDYFTTILPKMGEKTKSVVTESFMGLAEPFLGGILRRHFSGSTNIYPEWAYQHNKIIVLDFSIKEYLDAGIIGQSLFKLMFQQAIERRDTEKYPTPVFLWCDEAQYFVNPYDQIFLTTARSSRTATVYLSQNISNYYGIMGKGEEAKAKVDSLMGNLSTKIFHANSDAITNEYASRLIGNDIKYLATTSDQQTSFSIRNTHSQGMNAGYHPQIQPKEFTTFKTGGVNNDYKVEGILTLSGRKWSNEKNFLKISFIQDFKDKEK